MLTTVVQFTGDTIIVLVVYKAFYYIYLTWKSWATRKKNILLMCVLSVIEV